jgi:hypothetical protein
MYDKVVISFWHPFKFTENTTSEELSWRLRLSDLKSLFYSLFIGFQELIRC